MRILILLGLLMGALGGFSQREVPVSMAPLGVVKCADFEPDGQGNNNQWQMTSWNSLTRLDSGEADYTSQFKILYSAAGIYLLFSGIDNHISSDFDQDFQDLFKGDVFEAFFHPDTSIPLYLEYEISPLNKELVLMVPHINGKNYGWLPFHYSGDRRVKKMVHVQGGKSAPGATISSWTAELFIPFTLFFPLNKVPPAPGSIWNANFYRLDYDSGQMIKWAWSPVVQSFHEFEKFRQIRFQ